MALKAIFRSRFGVQGLQASALMLAAACATAPADPVETKSADDAALALTEQPALDATVAPIDAPPATPVAEPKPASQAEGEGPGGVTQEAEERWKIKVQQLQMQAEEAFLEGQRQAAQGNYADARVQFEQALNHIRWAPVGVEWGDLEARARAGLDNAERAQARKDAETRQAKDEAAYERTRQQEEAERQRLDQLVTSLQLDAIAAYNRAEYDEAERLADEVLKVDARNTRAKSIKNSAIEAARDQGNSRAIDERKEEFRRWKQDIEESRVPYGDILVPPDADEWQAMSARRNASSFLALETAEEPADRDLRNRLQNTVIESMAFPGVPVSEAINGISIRTGIPIFIDPEVAAELETNGTTLNLGNLNKLSVEYMLNLIEQQAGENITHVVRHGVVMITKKDKAGGKAIPRIHTVQDLTFALNDFRGPIIGEIPLPGAEVDEEKGSPFGSDVAGESVINPEEIITLIKDNIARDTWETEGHSIGLGNNNQILVIHTPEVHRQVVQFLDDLRRFSSTVVTIESRFINITDGFIQEIGVDWRGLGGSSLGEAATLNDVTYGGEDNAGLAQDNGGPGITTGGGLSPIAGAFFNDGSDGDIRGFTQNFFESALGKNLSTVGGAAAQVSILKGDEQYNLVIRAVEKSQFATTVSAPILTVFNTQRSYVTVTNQISFIQDFDVDVANSAFIANPNVGIIQEGVVLDVRPTISYDRKYITLEVQATVANLQRPIREFTTSLSGLSIPVTFQLPELEVQQVNTTVRVPDGGSLVLGGLKRLRYINRTASVPWLGEIPIVGVLFRQRGIDDETESLVLLVKANITDLQPWRTAPHGG